MKKNLLFLFMAMLALGFVACNDKDEIKFPINEEIAGSYKGTLDVSMLVEGSDTPMQLAKDMPQKVLITKAGKESINVGLKNFNFMNMPLGDITIENCGLTEKNGVYNFIGSQELNLPSPVGKCNAKVEGTVAKGQTTVNLDIDVIELKQTVKVVYKGTKLTGTENTEAKILSFTFDREVAAVDSLVIGTPVIDEEAKTITFYVADTTTSEYLKMLVPTIKISDKATITPASGVAQDFNKDIKYTVTAEDGTAVVYSIFLGNKKNIYDFEEWVKGVEGQKEDMTFYEPAGWASSNTGAQFLKTLKKADSYVIMPTEDAHSGDTAALIKTIESKSSAPIGNIIPAIPKVTTGSLFLGKFITDISNTLNSTKFGIPYIAKQPKILKGWYKYTPGETYYTVKDEPYKDHCHEAVVDNSMTDEFAISVVLYETDEYDFEKCTDCLTGVADEEQNIYTSSRIVAIGQLFGGEQADWKEFEIKLDYKKDYDPTKKYRMTIACSSSRYGDRFWGAPGSTLIVDDLELTAE